MKRHGKQFIIALLIAVLLTSVLPMEPIQAATKTPYEVCMDQGVGLKPPPGFPKCTPQGRAFNQKLFDDFGVVAYGKPESVPSNNFSTTWQDANGDKHTDPSGIYPRFTKDAIRGEWRYYGYDKVDVLYSNDFFPNDSKGKGTDPNTRKWVYRPWSNSLLNGRADKPSGFSPMFATRFPFGPDQIYSDLKVDEANSIVRVDGLQVRRSTDAVENNKSQKNLFDYIYVQQDPTVYAPGSGRMWHVKNDGAIWYQTFPIEASTGKKRPGNIATITPKNVTTTDLSKLPNSFTWKFGLQGTLKDGDYINNRYKKVEYYTRNDLKEWQLKVQVAYPNQPLTTLKTFSSKTNGDMSLKEAKKTAMSDIDVPLDKSNFSKDSQFKILLTVTSFYYDKNGNPFDQSVPAEYTVTFGNTPPPPVPEPEPQPETIPDPLVCEPNIPDDALDIVAFPASDSTDMSRVETRSVYVDGAAVDGDAFFGGAYIFGDDVDGLHRVDVIWTTKAGVNDPTDTGCKCTEWVLVHDTKPRAQYKLNGGTWKENRKMSVDNTSTDPNANDPFVQAAYPITDYTWSWEALSGSSDADRRMRVDTDNRKEFLYKKKGEYRLTLTSRNSLGRTSDPYVVDFTVLEDFAPAVILHPYSSEIARGETVGLFYDAVSTDGDIIDTQTVKVYYDSAGDETYAQLIDTYTGPITEYTPSINKLGKYRIVAEVDENFGQETFAEFITAADKRKTTQQFEFMVDNYIPYSDLYTDIPSIRPEVDLFLMLDKNLTQSKIDYVKSNGVAINNQLRYEGIDPQVSFWDMHTYTYSQSASTSSSTGSSYPSSSVYYCGGGYCGTLSRTSVSDNGYYYDYGHYETVTETTTVTKTKWETTIACDWPGPGWSNWYSYGEAACGTTYKWGKETTYTETTTTTKQVWVSDVRWVSSYTGYYSGTIYKDVRQAFTNPFTRTSSNKYVAYISDSIINEVTDFNTALSQSDAKVILVGTSGIASQTTYDHYIENSGQTIEEIIEAIVDYIASFNPPAATQTVLVGETFNLMTLDDDVENDPTIQKQTMYVQNENYYDNSQGRASFALGSYDPDAWGTETLRTSFSLPGEYTVYRRIKDEPDPLKPEYNYYSNEAQTIIRVHRKPLASATLDWTYNTSCSCYKTTWVDQSYDLDHQFSEVNRGIIDRKVRYQRNSGEWVYEVPDDLPPGTYRLEYLVQDMELVWSEAFVMNFTLASVPPIQISAQARTVLPEFSMTSIPASEQLRIYNIWTRYPYTHSLSVALFQGGVQRTTAQTVAYYTGTKTGDDIDWNDIVYTIQATTPDGAYTLRLTATGQSGQTNYLEWPVTVHTPINLTPTVPASGDTLVVNQSYDLAAITTKYATSASMIMFYGTGSSVTLTFTSTMNGSIKNWLNTYIIPSRTNGPYTARFTSSTPGGKSESVNVSFQLTNNRPPVAEFDWAPSPVWEGDRVSFRNLSSDPDGDSLTYVWELEDPLGNKTVAAGTDFVADFTAAGAYRMRLTVSDGKLSASAQRTITASELTLLPSIHHTPEWLEHHIQSGHEVVFAPKDFYSGEILLVESECSPVSVNRLTATLQASGRDGQPISVSVQLQPVSSTRYIGELFDAQFLSLSTGLANGVYHVTFRIEYTNGVVKTAEVPLRIIGHVLQTVGVHRRQ